MKREEFLARVRSAADSGALIACMPTRRFGIRPATWAAAMICRRNWLPKSWPWVDRLSWSTIEPPRSDMLASLVEQYQPKMAFCWQHPVLERLELEEFLALRGITRLTHGSLALLPSADQREQILAADMGITSVTFAIAETGSLVMMSQAGRERLASLLPPVHVAIVERAQILPDLFDLFAEIERVGYENLPSNLAFITGPSKTGDVEFTLTTGVHGPGKWHVIVVRA